MFNSVTNNEDGMFNMTRAGEGVKVEGLVR